MKRVYISHSNRNDRENCFNEMSRICYSIANSHENIMPISPLHMFSFLDDTNEEERYKALEYCLNLISDCDEIWAFGNWEDSEECIKEVNMGRILNKTIRYWDKAY